MTHWYPRSATALPATLRYAIAVLSVAIGLGLALIVRRFEGVAVTPFLMAIALTVWYAGRGPGFLATVLSILSVDYFFTPPLYRLAMDLSNLPYLVAFTLFGLVFSWFSGSRRRAEQALRQAHKELEVKVAERTAELRRSEARLAEGERLTHMGTLAFNAATSEIVFWSEEVYRLHGFDPKMGLPSFEEWAERVHPEDRERVLKTRERAVRERTGYEVDFRTVLPNGSIKYLHSVVRPVFNASGDLVEFVGSAMDVTDRKRAEQDRERLRQAEADLAYMSRVTTMGELTASLAHELKQPMAAAAINANTCLRWLTRTLPDVEEAREAAARIVKDVTRGADIISRFRALFEKGESQRGLVDVNEVIQEMIILLRSQATRYSISIRAELGEDLPQVMADRVQLQQVFMNLMLNGIEAMKDMSAAGELTIKSQQGEDGQLLISISDTGVGLPAEQTEQIFDAFFTTKPQGPGMGLPISRSIVESHGGRLWATPNSGRGATLQFTLACEVAARQTA
jgi:PAS domain S-box-containing protein